MNVAAAGRSSPVRAFLDDRLEAKFAKDGYVVVRLMEREQALELGRSCQKHLPANIPAHENVTYIYTDEPELAWIEEAAGPVFDNALIPLLAGMRRLHPSVIVKPAGERAVPPHVHPIFTLDQSVPTVFCWCALEDMRDENGVMQVLPGSQKLFPIMPMYGQEPYFLRAWPSIVDQMQPVYLEAGEAMLFDESLIHASLPNATGGHRLALATHCLPAVIEPIALFPSSHGQYAVYETGKDFGYQYHIRPEMVEPSERWHLLGYVDDVHEQVDPNEFWHRLQAGEHFASSFPLVPSRTEPRAAELVVTGADHPPIEIGWRGRARRLAERVFHHV